MRKNYEEHSERDALAALAAYHLEQCAIPLHWHREIELILTGSAGEIEREGIRTAYEEGDILCINSGVLHRTQTPVGSVDILVFDLRILLSPLLLQDDRSFLSALNRGILLLPERIRPSDPCYRAALRIFRESVSALEEKRPGWNIRLQNRLLSFLQLLWQHHAFLPGCSDERLTLAEIVKDSIILMKSRMNEPLTVDWLARQAHLSPSHYIRIFRRYTGRTPIRFLNDLRLETAAGYLDRGCTVGEASLLSGFSDASYFARMFRQKYGKTPKQYQLASPFSSPLPSKKEPGPLQT